MSNKNEQTIAHHAADIADGVVEGIQSATHSVGERVRGAAHSAQDAGTRAACAVEESYESASQFARDSVRQGSDRVRSWEHSMETCMRDHPKSVLLTAFALGAILMAWWTRR